MVWTLWTVPKDSTLPTASISNKFAASILSKVVDKANGGVLQFLDSLSVLPQDTVAICWIVSSTER